MNPALPMSNVTARVGVENSQERRGGVKLSIIIPAHNEEDNIADIVNKIEQAINLPYELVIVNDHSSDKTVLLAANLSAKYTNILAVENKFEHGFANAIKTGFRHATGQMVIPVMADLCDDLSVLQEMFQRINDGFDVVCGCRYIKGGARIGGSKIKAFLSRFAGKSLHFLLGVPTHDIANAFKMYRKEVIEAISINSKGFEISMELLLKAYYLGFRITEVPTVWKEREKGKSSFKVFKLLPNYCKLYLWAIAQKLRE